MEVVEIRHGKGALCAEILAALPDWFGMAQSNAAYARDVETMAMFAAVAAGERIGFVALKRHTLYATEIHVMGVRPAHHRRGAGRALVEAALRHAGAEGVRFLTVKTLSDRHPDPAYAGTRAFYEAVGFLAVEEFPTLWTPDNPALMLASGAPVHSPMQLQPSTQSWRVIWVRGGNLRISASDSLSGFSTRPPTGMIQSLKPWERWML
ncbi:MAG: GNAT family N-acetyltransferase [Rhizomicrobium sp.]